MNKQELILKVENMIYDKNFYINSNKGTEKQVYAWKYSRQDLQNVLKFINLLDNDF